jgi:tRNA (guanine-N7-)-methyltransferase
MPRVRETTGTPSDGRVIPDKADPFVRLREQEHSSEAWGPAAAVVIDLGLHTEPLDFQAVFGRNAPVGLEIGPGKGEFILAMAAANPDRDYLAVEYKKARVAHVARKVMRAELKNVRLIWADARVLLARFLNPGCLAAFFVNFPDPWPKRKHRSRRLVQQPFLDTVERLLAPGGRVTFGTDVQDYAQQGLDLFEAHPAFTNVFGSRVIRDSIEGHARTVFEQRFRDQGLPVYFVQFERNS